MDDKERVSRRKPDSNLIVEMAAPRIAACEHLLLFL
jgi:hypothetical protein